MSKSKPLILKILIKEAKRKRKEEKGKEKHKT